MKKSANSPEKFNKIMNTKSNQTSTATTEGSNPEVLNDGKEKKETYKELCERYGLEERAERKENLERKDYILTIHQSPDPFMGRADNSRMVEYRRYWKPASLIEVQEEIETMKRGFYTHPDLDPNSGVNRADIPHEEKKWGIIHDMTIEPLSEEKEKDYLSASKSGFFEGWRETVKYLNDKEVA
jgi:hypothetical protein